MKRPTGPVLAGSLHHGDLIRHDGLELALAIRLPDGWLCRRATESCGVAPSIWLPATTEVDVVREYVAPVLAQGEVADPLAEVRR